ncbi:MAG: right-handed parallel beta-helix repeat-containing protein, partial [Rhodobacteraceae bacterium]|nr:right-handed parallel beta-helix repeat-containing protein [Paracoccaceae bacterium]
MRRFWLGIFYVVLTSALYLPTHVDAQTENLRQLISNRSNNDVVAIGSGGATGRADVDSVLHLAGDPAAGSVLTAPDDDAIIAVFEGSDLTLTDLIFRQSGNNRFGLYIAGGKVTIDRCLFEGTFDTAIYMAAGTLTIKNCTLDGIRNGIGAQQGATIVVEELIVRNAVETGILAQGASLIISGADFENAGQNAVYVEGPVTVQMSDTVFSGSSDIQFALLNGASAEISDVGFKLNGGSAILVQDADRFVAREVEITGSGTLGVSVQGLRELELAGISIRLLGSPIQINGVAGVASLRGMQIEVLGAEGYGLNLQNIGTLEVSQTTITDGAVGMLLQGNFGAFDLSDNTLIAQTQYGLAIQDIYFDQNTENANVSDNVVITANDGIPLSLQDTSGLAVMQNTFVSSGSVTAILQNSERTLFSQNTLVTAPNTPESPEFIVETDGGRLIVSSGAANPLRGLLSFEETESRGANTYLTAATLVRSDYIDQEGRLAVAKYWSGDLTPDYTDLRMALGDMDADLAARAVEMESWPLISLAPPPDGFRWSSNAFTVTFRDLQGNEITAYPSDFPLRVPFGQQAVDMDSRTVAVLDILGDQTVDLPIQNAPYFIWHDEQGPVRGSTIQLRDPDVLRAMLNGRRSPSIGEYRGEFELFAARAGVTAQDANAARQMAILTLPTLQPLIKAAEDREAWPERQRINISQQQLLDFLVEFGLPEDVSLILNDLVEGGLSTRTAANTAVRLEQRLGLLENGQSKQRLAELLKTDPVGWPAAELADALSRTGDQSGIAAEIAIHQSRLDNPDYGRRVSEALRVLDYVDPEIGLKYNRQYLEATRDAITVEAAESDFSEAWGLISSASWVNVGRSLAYIAAYGDEADQSLLAIPVPVKADFRGLIEYAQSPSSVLSTNLGYEGPAQPGRAYSWPLNFGRMACPSMTWRTADDARFELESMRFLMRNAAIRDFQPEFYNLAASERQAYLNWYELSLDLSISHCYPTGNAPEIYRSESAFAEEDRKFRQVNPSYDPDWWVRPERAAIKMTTLKTLADWPDVSGFSPYSVEYVVEIMGDGGSLDPLFVEVFLLHNRLLTAAHQSPQNFYSFGAERRIFKRRSNGGNSVINSYGIVDIRPR